MKLITYYSYYGSMADPLDALHNQAKSGVDAIICRIRLCADNVPVVYKDPSVAQMCLREERVDELTYREIDALMQLGSRRLLTLDRLFDGYCGDVPVILHFRGFRPDSGMIHRTALDIRFLFASDSVQQIRFVADARERPISATVGPITAAGISLLIHATPTNFTTRAITTYTSPANAAPMSNPR